MRKTMFPEQVVEMENEEKGLVKMSAHDLMAQRINESKERMRQEIYEGKLYRIEEKRTDRIKNGSSSYRKAVHELAERFYGFSDRNFKLEDYLALDSFLKKDVLKNITFHGLWNAIYTYGLFSFAGFGYHHYGIINSPLGGLLFLLSLAGGFTQFLLNVTLDFDNPEDSEWRFLSNHFSFLWNRKYFLADAKEKIESQKKELAEKNS